MTDEPARDPDENPYWAEPEPHPDPSLGCIRRGLCCRTSPGWFAPGQAEQAAAALDMTPDDFVRQYLVIDWIDLPEAGRVHVFAPAKLARDGLPLEPCGEAVSSLYSHLKGRCIFYLGEPTTPGSPSGCRIYAARPVECARYDCTHDPALNLSHRAIALQWQQRADADD